MSVAAHEEKGLEDAPWPANRGLLAERWPELTGWLESATQPVQVQPVFSTPQPTLQIDGIHLASGYDRRREARLQAGLIPPGSRRAWVYGVGLGALPEVLLERQDLLELFVVLFNPAVARASFAYFNHSAWLADPRVTLLTADRQDRVQFPFAAVPSCLQLAAEGAAPLRDRVFLELATPYIRQRFNEANGNLTARLEENISFVASDGDVAELFGTRPPKRILVAGAGPSLADHFHWLAGRAADTPLIAVDAALKPLCEAGIRPDVVVSIDALREGTLPFFSGLASEALHRVPLVYFPCVHADILATWAGPRLTAYPAQRAYQSLAHRHPKSVLFSAGSVIHPAVDLAVRMGAKEIVLLGADFAFPGGESHVCGSPASQPVEAYSLGHWVLDGQGERVPTLPNLRGYLRDLEDYIARCPGVRFLNGSRKGALIQGADFLEETG